MIAVVVTIWSLTQCVGIAIGLHVRIRREYALEIGFSFVVLVGYLYVCYHLNIVIVHLKNTTEFDRVESCPGRGPGLRWRLACLITAA